MRWIGLWLLQGQHWLMSNCSCEHFRLSHLRSKLKTVSPHPSEYMTLKSNCTPYTEHSRWKDVSMSTWPHQWHSTWGLQSRLEYWTLSTHLHWIKASWHLWHGVNSTAQFKRLLINMGSINTRIRVIKDSPNGSEEGTKSLNSGNQSIWHVTCRIRQQYFSTPLYS